MFSDITTAVNVSLSNGLLISEVIHGIVSSLVAYYYYNKTKKATYAAVILLTTYLIDVDHWLDYVLYHGLNIEITKFVSLEYFSATGRAIVLLHAWEWSAILLIISYKADKYRGLLQSVGLGMAAHLIVDAATIHSAISYSILFRVANSFK